MAAARPTVSVYNYADESAVLSEVALPVVFTAPIRPDVVHMVHMNMAKNKRQAYSVKKDAGMETAAESWGTGRAVSRIPRVPGGGTHRAGQGAFGNMCRGGRMFAPTKVWRKWHRKVNTNQRRYAITSALAASAIPSLVMARGHRISEVPEVPLVLGGSVENIAKTAQAYKVLERFGASEDADRCKASKKIRRGKGKLRNRRYTMRRGPLVVYEGSTEGEKAFRNLPGVELANVDRLNLLQLAPGGHVGRFLIWTQGAFDKLETLYGNGADKAGNKTGFTMPRASMANTDLSRIINSDEIQKVLRPAKASAPRFEKKKNPLKNLSAMVRLNPYALQHRRAELAASAASKEKRAAKVAAKRAGNTKAARRAYYESMKL